MFQIISSVLTSEEEIQYRENATSLLDATAIRGFTVNENVSKKAFLYGKKLIFFFRKMVILKRLLFLHLVQRHPCGAHSLFVL